MNPLVIWRIVAGVGTLLGIGGTTYGIDQHQKRKREQAANSNYLRQIEVELASKEQLLASLQSSLGEKNQQVHILTAEIVRLRNEADKLRRML